ncbi:P protein-like isoform X2 [Nymphalis io]|uniref:P protein-like isoform X2 n=1 Tax=Inachis io TaxID=171585 RepID=UPI00216A865F|nr:P protein-like isoform X2 [Nymphalis io]XP_050358449.1 P protein-like isoform X2 [Nymphalis io]XP_050358450.1 P protein-like isoform X2 [Nymphalis io]XP_050358451.1 P protein-like isoform X2 [Nymphalis io]XP_050358452.1 P protein-like isoform X2 [Nymphalis io]
MAAILTKISNMKKKKDRNSVYSMVSCSDVTPGSLEVWVELPDAIKFDPALAPFKHMYEQHHGKLETREEISEGDRNIFNRKLSDGAAADSETVERNIHSNNKDENRLVQEAEAADTKKTPSLRKKQLDQTLRVVKLSALIAGWVLLTVSLLLNREKTDVVLHTAVHNEDIKEYFLKSTNNDFTVSITLSGPFSDATGNQTKNILQLWLHRGSRSEEETYQDSSPWIIQLQPDDVIDFSPSASDSNTLKIDKNHVPSKHNPVTLNIGNSGRIDTANNISTLNYNNESSISLRISTTSNKTVPLTVSYQLDPLSEEDGIIYATILLGVLYVLIIFEIVNRTIAAILSSSLGVAVLALSGARPSLPELVSWLDMETLLLLFSMMILVAILAETGLFDYLAVVAFEMTGGRTWPLINTLCFFTAIFSTFLDNVTTVLLMTPVTIRLCEVMQLNPVPVLMSMVIFSNVGGAATPVGDPPNVIIASHPSVLHANINFTTFTLHMGVGILLVCVQTYIQLRFMFRDMNKLRHSVPRDIVEMRQEIGVWKRAAASLSSYSRDEDIVRRALEKKVQRLQTTLMKREAGSGKSKCDPLFSSTLAQMKQKYRIRDMQLLVKSTICVTFVVVVFFLHAIPELQGLSLGWTALLGAILLLLLAEREDLEPVLARVEWSTLLFFAALFVLMEVLSKLGLIAWIGSLTESLILKVGEESRLSVAIMLILWVSGLASAFVDNIPLTTMMVRVVGALANSLALPLAPLAWALSFGACLGGNGTLIGASANVVCAGVAEQHGYRFTFMEFLKIGFPIMVGNLIVASIYLLICHSLFTWH